MAEAREDDSVAPRRKLGGPILPPPPPGMAAEAERAERSQAAAQRATEEKQAESEAAQRARAEKDRVKAEAAKQAQAEKDKAKAERASRPRRPVRPASTRAAKPETAAGESSASAAGARRTRRAQLRLVQVDAWSVMKTSFLLSIALGIVLVVAVAVVWSVLGASGVWDAVNSVVQQAVGGDEGDPFRIQEYVGVSRVLGFTMIVAVLDVVLVTAIATLAAFLYNLSAALLGGIEVTLAEDN